MSWFGHHHHNQPAPPASGPNQVFKIFCRANENYCLAVRDGAVVLAPVNPKDDHQHWYKDMRFSTRVKDEEGMPAFALVNKATGRSSTPRGRATPSSSCPTTRTTRTSPCSGPRAATSATASAASAWSTTSTSTSTPSTATRPTAASMTVPRSCSGSGARATTSAGRSSLGERTKETTSWYPNNNSAGCGD
ncbi:hydroxyproline-rich glycoprotein family protein, partial [Zea mays]